MDSSTAAKAYVDRTDGGALIPTRGATPECLSAQQQGQINSLYKRWEDIYKLAIRFAGNFIFDRERYDGTAKAEEAAARAEADALIDIGDAKPGKVEAAKQKWETAKADHAEVAKRLASYKEDLDSTQHSLARLMAALGPARDAYRAALANAKPDCPPPPKTSTGMVPPKGEPAAYAALDRAVTDEINQARTQPASYAKTLPHTGPGEEARAFLGQQAPLAPLDINPLLEAVAAIHVADEGPKGGYSHTGSDGSTPMQRMQNGGVWSTIYAEEIAVSTNDAGAIVRQLIIDQGVVGHPHRGDLFSPRLKFVGVACGANKATGSMCVIDLAAPPPPR